MEQPIEELDQNIEEEHSEDIQKETMLSMKFEALEQEQIITFVPLDSYQDEVSNEIENKPKITKYCSLCDKHFPYKSYYQHKNRYHRVVKFICDVDGKKFRLKSDLKEHMKIHENLDTRKRFLCNTCNNPFLSMAALKHHENFFHSDYIEEHPCLQCNKIFSSRMKVLQHIKTVHQEGTFVCNECNRIYASPASLKKHIQKAHSTKVSCPECGKLFTKLSLITHIKIHNPPEYECTFEGCERKFHTKNSFKRHTESHQRGLPVQCPACDATFPTSRHLHRHQKRQHTSIRANCEVANCFHSTTRKDYLVMHYKTHKELDDFTRDMLIARVKDLKDIGW
jgi:KRAB domain-containing zinc finger protein